MYYQINKKLSEKINIIKAISIILVIFVHAGYSEDYFLGNVSFSLSFFQIFQDIISNIMGSAAVPVFFFLSALLLYSKDFDFVHNIKKKVKTLVIPFFIMNTVAILIYYVLQHISLTKGFFTTERFIISNWNYLDIINAYLGTGDGRPFLTSLWFLRNLFLLNCFAGLISVLAKKYTLIFFTAITSIFLFLPESDNMLLRFGATSVFFWSLGYYAVYKQIDLENNKINSRGLWVLYIIYIALDVILKPMPFHYIIRNFGIIFGAYMLIFCFPKSISKKTEKFLLFVSKYTFAIYLFHRIPISFFKKLMGALLPKTFLFSFLEYILGVIFVLFLSIFISKVLKSVSKDLYSLVTGGR